MTSINYIYNDIKTRTRCPIGPEIFQRKKIIDEENAHKALLKTAQEAEEKERKSIAEEPQRLEIAQKIFQWVNNFIKTELYLDLIKTKPVGLFGYRFGLQLYRSGWGHNGTTTFGRGYNSIIYYENDLLIYRATYKWMGETEHRALPNPQQMAKYLHLDYLNEFWKCLESGVIYQYIQNNLK